MVPARYMRFLHGVSMVFLWWYMPFDDSISYTPFHGAFMVVYQVCMHFDGVLLSFHWSFNAVNYGKSVYEVL